MEIKKIREAVLANRGGHQESTDEAIMTIWNSLDERTQKTYLESVSIPEKKERKNDADTDRPAGKN